MSKHEEAGLILKLYDLRREPTMREARDWYARDFNPNTAEDVHNAMFSDHSGHLRMVASYWEMAAALVNHGAISQELFSDTNGEHLMVFAKIEPMLAKLREAYGPQFMKSLEKLIDDTPNARERLAEIRERMRQIKDRLANQQGRAASQA